MSTEQHRDAVQGMRLLNGHPPREHHLRAPHALLADIEAGATNLCELVSKWAPMLPRGGELVSATTMVEGLRKLLAELRQHVERTAQTGTILGHRAPRDGASSPHGGVDDEN